MKCSVRVWIFVIAFLLLSCACEAQVVRLANHTPHAFAGWVRRNVDSEPPHAVGEVDGALYVLGRRTGLDTHAVDIRVTLAPGERRSLDLSKATPASFKIASARSRAWTGGPITLNGKPMDWVRFKQDGAAWCAEMHLRTGRMMSTRVWLRHYPEEQWLHGELLTTCSNSAVPELLEDAEQLRLAFGAGIVVGNGRKFWQPIVDADRYADGQARAVNFTVLWPGHLRTAAQAKSWQAVHSMGIGAVGIKRLLPTGNPVLPPNANAVTYARQHLAAAQAALHDWRAPVASIAANSGQTGSQYDQMFRHGEPLLHDGAGAEWVSYLAALKYSNRPCHHLEANGQPVRQEDHPHLVFWSSRPHDDHGISRDRLGKDGNLAIWHVPGQWWGADRQHWLIGSLCAGARYSGSPAIQQLLVHQANAFLFGETVDPSLSTSGSGSARSVGYAAWVALLLWENLEDRALAVQVRDRFRERVTRVYVPQLGGHPGDIWDVRADGRILGDLSEDYTQGWMTWQQSLGTLLDVACERFDIPAGRQLAYDAAVAVLDHAWRKRPNGQWISWDNLGYQNGEVLPESEYVEGRGAHRTGWYDTTWCLIAPQIVLRHDPDNAKAREIVAQYGQHGPWVIPGINQELK